jgi:hypothetical protein
MRVALTIENGTGVTGADSFETVVECETFALAYYGQNMGNSTAHKEAALRRAFYYMQGLRWRHGLRPTLVGTIPAAVKQAQTLLEKVELTTTGALSPAVTLAGMKVLTKADTIGWQVIGGDPTVEASRPVITAAFDFLRPYLEYDPSRDGSIGYTGAMVV